MAEIMRLVTSVIWLVLAIMVFIRVKQWNRVFTELYDELKKTIRGENDNG